MRACVGNRHESIIRMTYRRIIEWPDKRLLLTSKGATSSDSQVFEDLKDTFRVSGGYGLSAPQIGFSIRAIVVNAQSLGAGDEHELLMINPVIVERSGTSFFEEACFSMPGMSLKISRDHKVKVRWESIGGDVLEKEFTGYASACMQHEIDHLDGNLMIDRLSQLRRSMIMKKINKRNLRNSKASGPSKEEASKRKAAATKKKLRSSRKKSKKTN